MMDKTSEAVADVVEDWILDHVANVRGPYHPSGNESSRGRNIK
jgi:hypothetical protein